VLSEAVFCTVELPLTLGRADSGEFARESAMMSPSIPI
jgi:hypothetical protein